MNRVRYGIIGCGVIHNWHVETLSQLPEIAELVAVCDSDPVALQNSLGRYPGHRGCTSLNELLASPDIDAVTICTPSGMHGEHSIAAAKAGKHVLTEKPIEVTLEKADAMLAAAKETGVLLSCISQNRNGSGIKLLHEWLDAGRLGRLVYGEAQIKWYRTQDYYDSGAWRGTWALDGGGALMNQGVHYADQLRWAMGKPKSVTARMGTLSHKMDTEDIVTATIEFESGALGSLTATTAAYPGFETRLEIYGTGGSVRVVNNELEIARFTDGGEYLSGMADVSNTGSSHPTVLGTYLHWLQIKDFTEAILEGREPKITGQDGRNAIELVTGIYKAARTGEVVRY